jgi:hypothetical protein
MGWYLKNAAFLLAVWTLISVVAGFLGLLRSEAIVLVMGGLQIVLAVTVFFQGVSERLRASANRT